MRVSETKAKGIVLVPMFHSSEVQCLDDDWSGLRDRAERRKRQNRLNVRAHRKRKAFEACQRQRDASSAESPREILKLGHVSTPSLQIVRWSPPEGPQSFTKETKSTPTSIDSSHYDNKCLPRMQSAITASPPGWQIQPGLWFLQAGKSRAAGCMPSDFQSPDLWFPLCRDNLVSLVYYNVFRATITNIHILSLTSLLGNSCTSNPSTIILFPSPSSVPPTLLPTKIQKTTPHEYWIDIFPSGTMRDNAIRFRGNYDHHELCSDLVGCQKGNSCPDQPGIIAWSDPWHPDGWEVTEKFIDKWGFLLKGCEDVMIATNRWRALRDEEPLVWDLE
ncbi:hypothetical protein CT0861_10295 [Colletotrichum tofieldiae]|uniref:BZIP domain-containing protein n=1 Tax=Colletotrichum tofieldiae TaxID=708197 RepID=A0A166PYG0_9PEZI|nr:hypothetical protein CT0861_10295 [Colletotrichum tofieldiae]